MSDFVETSQALCRSCKHSQFVNMFDKREKLSACFYISDNENHYSRVFVKNGNGKMRIDPKLCDKYEPREGKRLTGHQQNKLIF